ncbi:hypothetical protein S40285_06501 [Stachybotrys chlorohalonatus IBT 40285]|uniref:Glutamine-dependent NAD(+) synthetase n=1 Tax=Stachybotrys chlorohalonatus (strain IBT 40285) TaxID=1283841 RepID=A0A084QMH4_STAC4|nr:hypothetical protein S40285_06501 [Stachybotrys chlorohalonata IBT 40285]
MGRLVTVAACALRQWALDFEGNTNRIIESIRQAKAAGARLRVGPELEISGYSCNDHFLEPDLYLHCMEMLARILEDETCHGILLDIGLPVTHRNVNYNCRVVCLDGKILFIRPKMYLANDGNIPMTLDGVEIITNSSASHFSLQKLDIRLKLIGEATRKCGGVYIYSNVSGGDGERLYFDGCAMIFCNGQVLAQSPQFSLNEVDLVTATVDLEEVRAYRSSISRAMQAAQNTRKYHRIQTPFELSPDEEHWDIRRRPTLPREPIYYSAEEEIALCTGCYLWDYLARSKSAGYLAPLSGGLDSCATSVSVFSMCRLVMLAIKDENQPVIATVKRLYGDSDLPKTPQELCRRVLHTVYMGMSKQSSTETRQRAKDLSKAIGSYHINLDIDSVYHAQKNLVQSSLGLDAKFKVEGGTHAENLMLQNIQARTRMVTAYEFAQILPTTRELAGGGSLLVLGSANVGEALRGYMTKYDCSSADINPIGSIDKAALKGFIAWARDHFDIPCLEEFLNATPTAELEPVTEDYTQSDEADMGLTYAELTAFGRLRKERKMGPLSMWQHLVHVWGKDREKGPDDQNPCLEPSQIAEKVKFFFVHYAITRHKATTLTPALHCNDYSPDDNRFDLRPFLYPSFWQSWSFKRIDRELARIEEGREKARSA